LVARGGDRRCSLLEKGKEEQRMRGVTLMLAAMAVMVALFAAVATIELRGTLFSNVEHTAESRAEVAAKSIRSGETLRAEDVQELTFDGVFVIIRDGERRVLNDPLNLTSKGGAENPVYKKALDLGKPASGTTESGGYQNYIYAVPVDPPRGDARIVEAGKSYAPAQEVVRDVVAILATGIGVAFLLSIAGAYLLARPALR
jgi:two-component system, OmpR family, sensor kinase